MKEQIYAIPVNDAFKADTECAFCYMRDLLERQAVEFMMGPSYMEDDIRMETNKMGFCKEHYRQMYSQQNRLGLALMLHTHLQQINKDLQNKLSTIPTVSKKNLFSKVSLSSNAVSKHINEIYDSCYICNRIETTYSRFIDTFFYLWKKDDVFRNLVKSSKGFCLKHFSDIYDMAVENLSVDECNEFYKTIIPIEIENLKRIEEEVEWFTNKFDYRYTNEPWKNSKDAVPRAIEKVASIILEQDS